MCIRDSVRAARRRTLAGQQAEALERLVAGAAPSRKERVRRRAHSLVTQGQDRATRSAEAWSKFYQSLSKASQSDARRLREVALELSQLDGKVLHPDTDLCTRWIAARILDLGWTKERFGESDTRVREHRGENATDPISKKYERIAFQELCGHLVDHCLIAAGREQDPEVYEGPWQISETIDIDPSLLVRGDEAEADTSAYRLREIRLRNEQEPTWWRSGRDHQLNSDSTDDVWLSDTSDIPRLDDLISATDPDGNEWLALERYQQWRIKDPSDLDRNYQRDRRQLWIRTQANIIRADDQVHPSWAGNTNWMGLSHVSTSTSMWLGGLGEYPDLGAWPSELDLSAVSYTHLTLPTRDLV